MKKTYEELRTFKDRYTKAVSDDAYDFDLNTFLSDLLFEARETGYIEIRSTKLEGTYVYPFYTVEDMSRLASYIQQQFGFFPVRDILERALKIAENILQERFPEARLSDRLLMAGDLLSAASAQQQKEEKHDTSTNERASESN